MSKGNEKKAKADKGAPKANVSSYKSAQATSKPGVLSAPVKKPGSQIGRK